MEHNRPMVIRAKNEHAAITGQCEIGENAADASRVFDDPRNASQAKGCVENTRRGTGTRATVHGPRSRIAWTRIAERLPARARRFDDGARYPARATGTRRAIARHLSAPQGAEDSDPQQQWFPHDPPKTDRHARPARAYITVSDLA